MKRNTKAFFKLFLSYTMVLLLPLLCMGGIQVFMSRSMQAQNRSAYQSRMAYAADSINTIVKNIQTISGNILVDEDVQSFIGTAVIEKKTISDLYAWKDAFDKYHLDGFNVQSIHLYSSFNKWVIGKATGSGTAVKMDDTMYYVTLAYTGMTYGQWQEFAAADVSNGFYLMPSGELIYRMNIITSRHRRSILLLRVNTSAIAEIVHSLVLEGGYIAVCDVNGAAILSSGRSPFEDDNVLKEMVLGMVDIQYAAPLGCEAFSEETDYGWHILSFQPVDTLHSDIYQLSLQLFEIAMLMLVLDVILCLLLSRNNAAPLKRLTSFVCAQIPKEYLNNEDGYLLIENTMAMLIEKNISYRQLNEEQQELINFELMRCLLMGEYWNLEHMEPLLCHSCLPIEDRRYGVVTIPTRSGHDMRRDMGRICEAIAQYEARALSFHDRFVILFFLPRDTDETQWSDICHALAMDLNAEEMNISFPLCISNLYDECDQIHIAYDETVTVMEVMRADVGNSVLDMHFSGLLSILSETYYDYPIDMELQIIHALKMGNTTLVGDLLNEVRVRNYSERKLSAFMSRQLMFEVRGTVIRGMQPYLNNERINRYVRLLCQENTLDGLFQHIENLSIEIAEILHQEDDGRYSDMEETIYSFLSENYTNANLTLESLVELTGQSERFLYDFIRERFNSSFTKLLEGLRITKACALLRDGEATIKNVACQVGYNSDHTFRLAFKRVMNVTPSEYASAHIRSIPEKQKRNS